MKSIPFIVLCAFIPFSAAANNHGGKNIDTSRYSEFRKACDQNFDDACFKSASILYNSENKSDLSQARLDFAKSCDAQHMPSCAMYGRMLLFKIGGPRKIATSYKLLFKACKASEAQACQDIARLYLSGPSQYRDIKASQVFFQRGCSLGDLSSCQTLESLPKI